MAMRPTVRIVVPILLWAGIAPAAWGAEPAERPWRVLPLIAEGRVDPNWTQIGWGRFVVDDGSLRSDCDGRGLGLLLYRKEAFGDCQIRVVFRTKDAKSNSGVYVRIDDGILKRLDEKPPPA